MANRPMIACLPARITVACLGLVFSQACGGGGTNSSGATAGSSNASAGSGGHTAEGGAAGRASSGGGQSSGGMGGTAISTAGNGAGGASAGSPGSGGTVNVGGAPGSAGSGGSPHMTHPGECIYPPTASERKAPPFTLPAPANPNGLILRFMNNCPQSLWVHADGIPGGVVELAGRQAGQAPTEKVYDWPGLAGRISVNEGSADGFNINFLEMNANKQALNVNLSNVDWVGLPVEVKGDNPSKCLTACYTPLAHMMDGCPAQLLDSAHQVCQAPKNWCNGNNAKDSLCTALDAAGAAVIANDPKCKDGGSIQQAGTGASIYACGPSASGNHFWDQNPICCAEVNRGYLTDVNDPANDDTQNCNYYKTGPFSTYSAYAQTVCPFVYAFAYDDVNNQSGYQPCTGAKEMDVTWCPGDP
jgi:hypothetical protein